MSFLPTSLLLVKNAVNFWRADNASLWCAALAYYTLFSLGPLLFVIISLLGLILSPTSIESTIHSNLNQLMGQQGASLTTSLLNNTQLSSHGLNGLIGTIIGFVLLFLGGAGIFNHLEQMLNHIWGVKPNPKVSLKEKAINQLINFSLVGVIAFLLLVSLIISTILASLGNVLSSLLPLANLTLQIVNFIVSFGVISLLFGFIFKVLPDVEVKWKSTWLSALTTALLFSLGKTLIGWYIGRSNVSSSFGATSSVVIILLWVYYSSQILFFGVELTKAVTLHYEQQIIPSRFAILSTKAKQQNTTIYHKRPNLLVELASSFTAGLFTQASNRPAKKRRSRFNPT